MSGILKNDSKVVLDELNYVIVGLQQRDCSKNKELDFDEFNRAPLSLAQCILGIEKHPKAGMNLN